VQSSPEANGSNRRRFYAFRLTPKQKRDIDGAAGKAGVTRSAWVREHALELARSRKKLPDGGEAGKPDRLTVLVSVLVTEREFRRINEAARRFEVMPSVFVRAAALSAIDE
jgi:hypothetical protein